MEWILKRLSESSTKAGLTTIIALIGWKLSPELIDQLWVIIIAAINVWQMIRKEQPVVK